jgi:hypothetical protein
MQRNIKRYYINKTRTRFYEKVKIENIKLLKIKYIMVKKILNYNRNF